MQKRTINNIRLGLFVLIGTVFLIAALYLIGNNRNIFDSTFTIKATFYKVNGLMKGNNVRFSGIDVGTVRSVRIASDSTVEVTMIIESHAQKFIRKNALASVGTDGLMGNKLVEIDNVREPGASVEDGDAIATMRPIETDQMMRVLDQTNRNLAQITSGLKEITRKLNDSHGLWAILSDTAMAENVKLSISSIRTASRNTASFTRDLNALLQDVQKGKGMINYLVYDTLAPGRLRESLTQIDQASDTAAKVAHELKLLTEKLRRGEGAAGILLSDSLVARDLTESMHNIRVGTVKLNENMEAMRHNFLFRGYFKKQEKEARKAQEEAARKK